MTAAVDGVDAFMRLMPANRYDVPESSGNFPSNALEMQREVGPDAVQSRRQDTRAGAMPTILRHGRWRIFFYSNEGAEPAHVHVEAGNGAAKFWLTPVALVGSLALKPGELRDIERFVRKHRTILLEAWNEYFGR